MPKRYTCITHCHNITPLGTQMQCYTLNNAHPCELCVEVEDAALLVPQHQPARVRRVSLHLQDLGHMVRIFGF